MQDDDPIPPDCQAVATGILHCLQMLAEEADNLRLVRTRLALRKAIRACQIEQTRRLNPRPRRGMVLH